MTSYIAPAKLLTSQNSIKGQSNAYRHSLSAP